MNVVTRNVERSFPMTARRGLSWVLAASLMMVTLLAAQTQAGLIATNGDVPSTMDAGGTAADAAIYELNDGNSYSHSSFTIGSTTAYNELHVINGSSYASTGSYQVKVIGNGTSNNALRVNSGTFSTNSGYTVIGNDGDYNTLELLNGATATIGGNLFLGGNAWTGQTQAGSYNSIIVDGSGTMLNVPYGARLRIGNNGGSNNSVTISNGGVLSTYDESDRSRQVNLGYSGAAANNDITVTGSGSMFITTSIYIGSGEAGSANNTLTAANSGLARLGTSGVVFNDDGGDNYVRLGAGYVAISGNNTGALVDGDVLVWEGSAYVAGTKGTDWTATYYDTDADALAATGYSGLGGYTIFTGGMAIPEPTTMAVLLSGMAMVVARRRQR